MKTLISIFVLTITTGLIAQENIHAFKVEGLNGDLIDMAAFKGKKILVVNTASKCGFTKQYKELQELHEQHADGLVVIGFPANDFAGQEPGSNEEIAEFCEKNYGVTFPMAAKISVKGDDQHELFSWLCAQENPDFTGKIKWNFEKFLLDENGVLVHRYRSGTKPMSENILSAL